ncbi:MAG: hypothetical protein PHO32_08710 [Candidatus Cloacimonetes bacterium]|nr:hypothetical protein [Candidatus Cloacimonadota bacterium]
MKRFICVLLLTISLGILAASAEFTRVYMEDHNSAVVRVVVVLSQQKLCKISTSGSTLEVSIDSSLPQNAAQIAFVAGGLLSGIQQEGSTIQLQVKQNFRYERSSYANPYRIVIDIFKTSPNKDERLSIANFYAETGKLNSADNEYFELNRDYPKDAQILYHWGVLLTKRQSDRATKILMQIPAQSAYYPPAKGLLAKIHADEEPLPPPPPINEEEQAPNQLEPPVQKPDTVSHSQDYKAVCPPVTEANTCKGSKLLSFLPIVLVEAVLLSLFIFLLSGLLKKKPLKTKPRPEAPELNEANTGLETKTLKRMVSKLLADGWTPKEIARELKLKQKDVEHLVHLCQTEIQDKD